MKILIVDDSRTMRGIVKKTLVEAGITGHVVLEAGDAAEAMESIREDTPDLALFDVDMGDISGIDAIEQLQSEGWAFEFAFITALRSPKELERAEKTKPLFILHKPFHAMEMKKLLNSFIRKHNGGHLKAS